MVHPEEDKLAGMVIIDDYPLPRVSYRDVLIAVELKKDKRLGRIRINYGLGLESFIKNNIRKKSIIVINRGVRSVGRIRTIDNDYAIEIVRTQDSSLLQPVNSAVSILKRKKLFDTQQCPYKKEHLNLYLNECCFKFNKRKSKEKWFDDLLQNAVNAEPFQMETDD